MRLEDPAGDGACGVARGNVVVGRTVQIYGCGEGRFAGGAHLAVFRGADLVPFRALGHDLLEVGVEGVGFLADGRGIEELGVQGECGR